MTLNGQKKSAAPYGIIQRPPSNIRGRWGVGVGGIAVAVKSGRRRVRASRNMADKPPDPQ
eukprot:1156748-Pelagomonas_calceolata.AAC.4